MWYIKIWWQIQRCHAVINTNRKFNLQHKEITQNVIGKTERMRWMWILVPLTWILHHRNFAKSYKYLKLCCDSHIALIHECVRQLNTHNTWRTGMNTSNVLYILLQHSVHSVLLLTVLRVFAVHLWHAILYCDILLYYIYIIDITTILSLLMAVGLTRKA